MPTLKSADPGHTVESLPLYPWVKQEVFYPGSCTNRPFPHLGPQDVPGVSSPPPPIRPPSTFMAREEPAETAGSMLLAPLVPRAVEPLPQAVCAVAPMEHCIPNLLISPHMLPLTDLDIKFQYCGLTTSNPHSCCLFFYTKHFTYILLSYLQQPCNIIQYYHPHFVEGSLRQRDLPKSTWWAQRKPKGSQDILSFQLRLSHEGIHQEFT